MTKEDPLCSIPVFRPTWEEFKNFSKYVESIEDEGKKFGLVKIIPPKEFIPRAAGYHFDRLGYVGKSRNENKTRSSTKLEDPAIIHSPVRQHVNGSRGVYEVISIMETDYMTVHGFSNECDKRLNSCSRRERKYFQDRDFKQLERAYWSNISHRSPPLYGADSPGSLFDKDQESWNCNDLGTILNLIRNDLPGVTLPMLYFGMWQSTFSWHVEDMNLFSINYLHFGKPKQWYGIPGSHFEQTERVLKGLYPHQARHCAEFLRHKKCVVSPKLLESAGIPVYRAVQHEGEFMITFPKSFHAGFNYGFNCAESVNFALLSWVPEGCGAKFCRCVTDSVRIDMIDFVKKMTKRKIISEDHPYVKTAQKAEDNRKKSMKARKGVVPWSCPLCTFRNNRTHKRCTVCGYRPNAKQMKVAKKVAKEQMQNEAKKEEKESGENDSSSEKASTSTSPDELKFVDDDDDFEEDNNEPKKERENEHEDGLFEDDDDYDVIDLTLTRYEVQPSDSSQGSSSVGKKRALKQDTRPSKRPVNMKHEIRKLFNKLGIALHYADKIIRKNIRLEELLSMDEEELMEILPIRPRVRLCDYIRNEMAR
mmetsp:Transcript_35918/g.57711  ORF Transcript_35918/g.57711 Transcript_35918/m.57711 type:complete len:591 (-) Transcript_35918:206-1978(-)